MPSKFSPAEGMFGENTLVWRAASGTFLCLETGRGFGLASCRTLEPIGFFGISRSGSETSFRTERPTMIEGACLLFFETVGSARCTGESPLAWNPTTLPPASTELAPAASATNRKIATTIGVRRPARRRDANDFIPPVLSFVGGIIGDSPLLRQEQQDPEGAPDERRDREGDARAGLERARPSRKGGGYRPPLPTVRLTLALGLRIFPGFGFCLRTRPFFFFVDAFLVILPTRQ